MSCHHKRYKCTECGGITQCRCMEPKVEKAWVCKTCKDKKATESLSSTSQIRQYMMVKNIPYFLVARAPKVQINIIRFALGLGYSSIHMDKDFDGLWCLYIRDAKTFSDAFGRKFEALKKEAKFLDTNLDAISATLKSTAFKETHRKEEAAKTEYEQRHSHDTHDKPHSYDYQTQKFIWEAYKDVPEDKDEYLVIGESEYRGLKFLKKVQAKVWSEEDLKERLGAFRKRYLTSAVELLKVVKIVFPKECHHHFINILKNLKIEPRKI